MGLQLIDPLVQVQFKHIPAAYFDLQLVLHQEDIFDDHQNYLMLAVNPTQEL
ncbi:unnamed protein product [Trichobilharzia regenti]|nr:unnamed protein product [Trichobilharzia regenti]